MGEAIASSVKSAWLVAAMQFASVVLSVPTVSVAAQMAAPAAEVYAKSNLAGDWQGILTLQNGKKLRTVVRIFKADGGYAAKWYSIDQDGSPVSVSTVAVSGARVRLTIDMLSGTYDGILSADGATMMGIWTEDANPLPLTLVRATKATAWEIPAAPSPMKSMPDGADPTFDVATIKPNNSGGANIKMLRFGANDFEMRNASLLNVIAFAYDVQAKQIIDGPEWISHDRYDIKAKADIEGFPNPAQQRSLVRKLLADRFKLSFHTDKKEMSAYVLTVGNRGAKLKQTGFAGPGMSFGFLPENSGTTLLVRNATMAEFSGILQSMVLDWPVVNDTGLTGKYNFSLKFMPDESQFNGSPPMRRGQGEAHDAAPSLFETIRQQLGLKLEEHKAAVDTIAIDHVEKPSAN